MPSSRALVALTAAAVVVTGAVDAGLLANAATGGKAQVAARTSPMAAAGPARRTEPAVRSETRQGRVVKVEAARVAALTPRPIWVGASIATVWVKPGRTRPVDHPALRAEPRIARWISAQTFRQRSDLADRVMTQALHGDELVLVDRRPGWSKVRLPDQRGSYFSRGIVGWVPSRQLTQWQPRHHVLPTSTDPHGTGRQAVRIARDYLGIRYLWGGLSKKGIDCSGLTYRVYRQLGIVLPRDAADQSQVGTRVGRHELRRGDLVFFGPGDWRTIHHVGIYAGNGRVLHAPHTGSRVQVTPLRAWSRSDYWGARRLR